MRLISVLKYYLLITTLFLSVEAIGQGESSMKKHGIFIKLDNRRTHIHGNFTSIYGLYAGFKVNDRFRIKAGINAAPFKSGRISETNETKKASRLYFMSVGEKYSWYENKKINLFLYLNTGFGWHVYESYRIQNQSIEKEHEVIMPIELGNYLSYHLNPWIDLKIGGGWRWVLIANDPALNNYYVKLGSSIHLKQLREHLANKKKPPDRSDG